jgi:hypothetical protein
MPDKPKFSLTLSTAKRDALNSLRNEIEARREAARREGDRKWLADERKANNALAYTTRQQLSWRFPQCFDVHKGGNKRPLMVGTKEAVKAAAPDLDGWAVALALRDYQEISRAARAARAAASVT